MMKRLVSVRRCTDRARNPHGRCCAYSDSHHFEKERPIWKSPAGSPPRRGDSRPSASGSLCEVLREKDRLNLSSLPSIAKASQSFAATSLPTEAILRSETSCAAVQTHAHPAHTNA